MPKRKPLVLRDDGDFDELDPPDLIDAEGISSDTDLILEDQNGQFTLSEIQNATDINSKNVLAIALDLAAISAIEDDDNLTFFVDSFDTDTHIDPASTNFEVLEGLGLVQLIQGGSLEAKDSTEAQFSSGIFTDTEAFDDAFDGALRKELLLAAGQNSIENFDSIANVVTTGDAIQSLNLDPSNVTEGSGSLKLQLDFSGVGFTEAAVSTVTFSPLVDISLEDNIKFSMLKKEDADVLLTFQVEDDVGQTFDFTQLQLISSPVFQILSFTIGDITSGNPSLDMTSIKFMRITLDEGSTEQVIVNNDGSGVAGGNREGQDCNTNTDLEQTFEITESRICKRLLIRAQRSSSVEEDLHVAIADFFNTSLGSGILRPVDATTGFADYVIELDRTVQIQADVQLKILVQSTEPATPANRTWELEKSKTSSTYPDGSLFVNSIADGDNDMFFSLFAPPPKEDIFIDNLLLEGQSVFEVSGSFVSRAFNLGGVPATLDFLSWTEVSNGDSVSVRIKFAATEGLLASASFSSPFTDPTGAGNNLNPITEDKFFQYDVTFASGIAASSNIIRDLTLAFSLPGGGGSATVISVAEATLAPPSRFYMIWQDDPGTGAINYFASRDGGSTFESVLEIDKGKSIDFTVASGNSVQIKAVMSGNAQLFGWAIGTDEEFS